MGKTSDPLKAVILSEIFPPEPSKAQRRRLQIVEAAIESFAEVGIEKSTYERLAKRIKVSRPLIIHYFPDRDDLVETTLKFIRARFQRLAVDALSRAEGPEAKLKAYVEATFDWIARYDKHAKVWLLFYFYCGVDGDFKAMNTELARMGEERIAALIVGLRAKSLPKAELLWRAKQIQIFVTGALIAAGTETPSIPMKSFVQKTVARCLAIAQE